MQTFNKITNAADLYRLESQRSGNEVLTKEKLKDYSNCRETANILENWKRWMEIRKKFHENAKAKIDRTPKQLVMNRSDAYRKKIQDRLKLLYARIPQASKERGSPGFWALPVELKPKCPCLPPLFAVLTKEEKFEIPEIDFAGIPQFILKEKGFDEDEFISEIPQKKDKDKNKSYGEIKDMWEESKYRKEREKMFAKDIKRIQKIEPDIKNLCLTGHVDKSDEKSLEKAKQKQKHTEKSSKDSKASEDEDKKSGKTMTQEEGKVEENEEIVIGIEIGDTIINSKLKDQTTQKYYVCIDYYIPDDGVIKHQIPIRNAGDVVIKYSWDRVLKKNSLDIIPKRNPCVAFCFKKSQTVLMISENSTIDIYFQIEKPGFYEETWELQTIPKISQNVKFVLVLWAFAEVSKYEDICKSIHDRIDEGVKQKIVNDVIVKLLARIQVEKPEEYLPNYHKEIREEDIFNSINSTYYNLMSKPTVYYHQDHIVSSLKELYKALKGPEDPENWDLDLKTLSKMIENIPDVREREFAYLEFKTVTDKMLKTSCRKNKKKEVFEHVYYLLCATIDQITEYVFKIRQRFNVHIKEKYPKSTVETVLNEITKKKFHEKAFFPNTHDKPSRQLKVLEKLNCPKLHLQGSLESPEVLYQSYFKEKYNIAVSLGDENGKDKGKKGKGKGKAKGSKSPKDKDKDKDKESDKKSKSGKAEKKELKHRRSIQNIPELTLEDLISTEESSSDEDGTVEKKSSKSQMENSELYYNNLYMVTYDLLSRFVEDLVCAVDGFNERIMPHFLLKFLVEEPSSEWKIDHGGLQKPFDVDVENYDAESVLSEILSSESYSFLHSDEEKSRTNLVFQDFFTQTSGEHLYPCPVTDEMVQTLSADDIDKEVLIDRLEIEKETTSVHTFGDEI